MGEGGPERAWRERKFTRSHILAIWIFRPFEISAFRIRPIENLALWFSVFRSKIKISAFCRKVEYLLGPWAVYFWSYFSGLYYKLCFIFLTVTVNFGRQSRSIFDEFIISIRIKFSMTSRLNFRYNWSNRPYMCDLWAIKTQYNCSHVKVTFQNLA